jgi:hypothetical protein
MMWVSVSYTWSPSQSFVIFEGIFPEARLICLSPRPLQIVLDLSNFSGFEQLEATFAFLSNRNQLLVFYTFHSKKSDTIYGMAA